ncbi:asparaginase [Ramlibacter humi]|uniref:Asparaginase n=1 Tax=Ramlibacter humi TaxID=2530451 RepID=A0A4Z0C9E0_9BURK|nr:asparaginase [Ramlibacter humi]TFZ08297.1 asparaginase [Ramlibacter humi]
MAQRIVVLGTGGTIAGRGADASDHLGYKAGEVAVKDLLADIPLLAGVSVSSEQVAQIDSKDLSFDVLRKLAARCAEALAQDDVQAIVITHGTDTIEETAWFLQRVLAPAKPIVLACAMRPATAISPDGPQNLVDAFTVARHPGARGAVVVCAGQVHGAADVRKVHPHRLDAFGSGDAGSVGYVEAGHVRQLRAWPQTRPQGTLAARIQAASEWPWVEIVTSGAGADGRVVDALVAAGVRGLVAAGTGNGSLNSELESALRRAEEKGVRLARASRCLDGTIVGTPTGALRASALTPAKARIDLVLDLLAA